MRKSPIKHHVHSHKRVGVRVHDYDRGHGLHPTFIKPHMNKNQSIFNYTVNVKYISDPTESIPIHAPSFPEAILTAMTIRKYSETPKEVEAMLA